VAYWTEQMAQDADKRMVDRKEDRLKEELQKFMDNFNTKGNSWI